MNKTGLIIIAAILFVVCIVPVHAALAGGSWTANNDVTYSITNGQTAEFEFRVQAVSSMHGHYSIYLTAKDNPVAIRTYVLNKYTTDNGDNGYITVTPADYGFTGGVYNIKIYAVDDLSPDLQTLELTVNPGPVALHATCSNVDPASGEAPLTVAFAAAASGGSGAYTYTWDFNDNTPIDYKNYNKNTDHTYSAAGTYVSTITVTDVNTGETDTATCPAITVKPQQPHTITGTCTANPTTGTGSLFTQYTLTPTGGSGTYTKYSWDFLGTGTYTDTVQNPTYNYNTTGTYTAQVQVYDNAGNSGIITCTPVTINPVYPPNAVSATCTANPESGAMPLTVAFGTNATGGSGDYVYEWDFTGSNVFRSNAANPSYIYTAQGQYSPRVIVYDANDYRNNATVSCPAITVTNATPITIFCTANVTDGTVPLAVHYDASASGGTGVFTTYHWNIDNTSQSSTNPYYDTVFGTAGVYTISVNVVDTAGNMGATTCPAITVKPQQPHTITGTCTANPTTGTGSLFTQYTLTPTGGSGTYTKYSWDFLGTGTYTDTVQNPTYNYNTTGTYTAQVQVYDNAGNSGIITCTPVTINPIIPNQLSVSCTANPTSGIVPLTVSLSASASGGTGVYTGYAWAFGDGITGSGQNTNHQYTTTGAFLPQITVTDSNGTTASAYCNNNVPIVVNPPTNNTNASLSANPGGPYYGYVNEGISFDGSRSTGPIVRYLWDFGDGVQANATTPTISHVYLNKIGVYTVRLTVYDAQGNSATATTRATIIERTYAAQHAPVANDDGLYLEKITIMGKDGTEGCVRTNDDLQLSVDLKNYGKKLKDAQVKAIIPDLGIESEGSMFDLNRGGEETQSIVVPIYNTQKGLYTIKVVVYDDNVRRIKYRDIQISDTCVCNTQCGNTY